MVEQLIRPRPNKSFLSDLCGGNQALLSSLHHGLHEYGVALYDFYPCLNLDELVAFAASSWKSRDKDINAFRSLLRNRDIFGVFDTVNAVGLNWLDKHNVASETWKSKYNKLNPFDGRTLVDRLGRVDSKAVAELIRKLGEDTNKYVFECKYHREKEKRDGDNIGLEIMNFQNYYPKKGKIVPAYAKEVARFLSTYPLQYEMLEVDESEQGNWPDIKF